MVEWNLIDYLFIGVVVFFIFWAVLFKVAEKENKKQMQQKIMKQLYNRRS